VDQPEPVDSLEHLGLSSLLGHRLDPRSGADSNPLRLPVAVEQERSLIVKTPGQSADLDYCARGGPDLSGPLLVPLALAVPAAPSMEAAGHAVAKTTGVSESYAMSEAASHAMGEAVAESGDT
jgi:hypothetical protein